MMSAEDIRLRKRERGDRKLSRTEHQQPHRDAAEQRYEAEADRRLEAALLAEMIRRTRR